MASKFAFSADSGVPASDLLHRGPAGALAWEPGMICDTAVCAAISVGSARIAIDGLTASTRHGAECDHWLGADEYCFGRGYLGA
jgi:hypothetical protein